MATSHQNMSSHNAPVSIKLIDKKFSIVVSEYNSGITESLYEGCVKTLIANGVNEANLVRRNVPGAFELTLGAQYEAQNSSIDAVICLGCVVQGDTKHFDFICQAVANGITDVGLKYNKPVIFGVLTPNTQQQAVDRSGGKHGNKGDEAALAAIKMLA